jgi:SAM-dependent methyltransferase
MADSRTGAAPCPCCQATAWQSRWAEFVVCQRCGLMTVAQQTSTAFGAQELHRLYGPDYFHGGEYADYLGDKSALSKTLAQHLRAVRRWVPAGNRLLEIGCAYGFFLELIAQDYPGSVGLDVSAQAVEYARARGLDARLGDVLTKPLEGRFAAVCLWDTLEHLAQPRAALERCVALLEPGGYLFVSTGDFGSCLARLQGRRWRQIHPPTHLFYFTRTALRALCEGIGLEVLEFQTVWVYRRVKSALHGLQRLRPGSVLGRLAVALLRGLPGWLLNLDLPLNTGDTLRMTARKRT